MRAREYFLRLLASRCIADLRRYFSGRELREMLERRGVKLSDPEVSRYATGRVIPSLDRAIAILETTCEALSRILERLVVIDERGVVNVSRLAFELPLLRLAAVRALMKFGDEEIDRVLTAAVNGIPLATLIANYLGAELCVAKQHMDALSIRYLEVKYFAPSPPRYQPLYLPEHMLPPGCRVLLVDDLLQSGRTLGALANLVKKAGARVVGVFSLLGLGREWRDVVEKLGVRLDVVLEVANQ